VSLEVERARVADAAQLASLHNAVAERLTREHGRGHWSHCTTERGVRWSLKISRVLVARRRRTRKIVATAALQTRKPWAIDVAYFAKVPRPLYLVGLAVDPKARGRGLGRRMIAAAIEEAKAWPADAIRLDAYDTAAGAGTFYAACGFREVGRVTYKGTPLRYFEMRLSREDGT
jgi:GNAT superfamily N-acetyltransferase